MMPMVQMAGATGAADRPDDSPIDRGLVIAFIDDPGAFCSVHERVTRDGIARRLARLKGFDFGGSCDHRSLPQGSNYLVPGDTLVGELESRRLGVSNRDDLFGGVVPFGFVASKAITHPLVDDGAAAPTGWSNQFARRVAGSVLAGLTAFNGADALLAGHRLLADGPVRVKAVRATGGRGQEGGRQSARTA